MLNNIYTTIKNRIAAAKENHRREKLIGALTLLAEQHESVFLSAVGIEKVTKKWYRETARMIHPDKCDHPLADRAFQELNSLYRSAAV